jgi:hypothetical protein
MSLLRHSIRRKSGQYTGLVDLADSPKLTRSLTTESTGELSKEDTTIPVLKIGDIDRESSRGSPRTSPRTRTGRRAPWARGLAADVSAVLVLVSCVLSSCLLQDGLRYRSDPLFEYGLTPIVAIFLYGGAMPRSRGGGSFMGTFSDGGSVACLLRHDALAGFGGYCFQACLWHSPMHTIFNWMGDVSGLYTMHAGRRHPTVINGPAFAAFALSLCLVAGCLAEWIEAPLADRLRSGVERVAGSEEGFLLPMSTLQDALGEDSGAMRPKVVPQELAVPPPCTYSRS